MNQKGLSSMVILIITLFAIVIAWELGVYVDKFILTGEETKLAKKCIGSDPRDCYDTEEGVGIPIELPEELEVFGWIDDGKP